MSTKTFIVAAIIAIACSTIIACSSIIPSQAQEGTPLRTITGTVVDSDGEPLLGATIQILGASGGAMADMGGRFSIDVPEGAVLIVRFIGMREQRITVDNQQEIHIQMEVGRSDFGGEFFGDGGGLPPAQPIVLTRPQTENVVAGNRLAFLAFREVSRQEGVNTFFSPLSLNIALAMLLHGATGENHVEMANALGVAHLSAPVINSFYRDFSQALLTADPSTQISISNSIALNQTLSSVNERFVENNRRYFNASVRTLDFRSPTSVNTLNEWVAENTNNRIPGIIENLDPMGGMVVMNALHFKAKWRNEIRFDEANTRLDNFTTSQGERVQAYLMERTTWYPYFENDYFQSIEMQYGNGSFSMVVILPREELGINQLIEKLDIDIWEQMVNGMERRGVWLRLPRFTKEATFSLNSPLHNLGIRRAFNTLDGFRNISDAELQFTDAIQQIFVEVNEEGTEAVAVTTMFVTIGSAGLGERIPPIPFIANRPFLYVIRERSTGAILFMGRMDNPKQ